MHLTRRWVLVFTFVLLPWSVATAQEAADLSLTNTASPSPVQATTTLTYSMNVFNNGPTVVATGVQVTDTLPPGVTLVSAVVGPPAPSEGIPATTTQGTCSGTDTVVCDIGNLTVGGGVAVTIVVRPPAPGELSNTATVSGNEPDPDSSNNTVTALTLVVERPSPNPTLTDPDLAVSPVVTGLTQPTSLAFLGPEDFLVLEKSTGFVKHVVDGVVQGVVLDLAVNFAVERGLLGIALHPDFANNGFVYLYWTCRGPAAGEDCEDGRDTADLAQVPLLGNRVDRYVWDGTTLTFDQNLIRLHAFQADADQNGLFTQPLAANHNGGKLAFGPDGKLYILFGDNGRRGFLQNLTTGPLPNGRDDQFGGPEPDDAHFTGVILRLNDDGTTPVDNPFVVVGQDMGGEVGANIQKIFAYGVRNGFGMAFDPLSRTIFMAEDGDDSFPEINRVEAGFNGGWVQIRGPVARLAEYKAIETSPVYFGLQQERWPPTLIADTPEEALSRLFLLPGAHYTEPLFSWKFEAPPAGLGFVRGQGLGREHAGDLIVGAAVTSLLGGQLWRFRLNNDRDEFVFSDPRLDDLVADNLDKNDLAESESLLFGQDFGIVTDIQTGPNGHLFVVSLSKGAIYEIHRP
jgi:aldose sugar dehydrogenase